MTLCSEEWRNIPGYEGKYQVSSYGNVRSISRRIWNGHAYFTSKCKPLKPNTLKRGYYQVYLYGSNDKKDCLQVHRLVAMTFIPNPLGLPQVNHINGNKQDNRVVNLEWTDNSGNQIHAYKIGLQKPHNAWLNRTGVRCALLVDGSSDIEKEYPTAAAAARDFGEKTSSNLIKHLTGKRRTFHKRKFIAL